MAIAKLNLVPRNALLRIAASSYSSSETRLDMNCSFESWDRIFDQHKKSLSDASWNLSVFDGSASVHAEIVEHGVGSIRYRPPSPSAETGDYVVQADLSSAGFAALLAATLAGNLPAYMHVAVDGVDDDGAGNLIWDREANPLLLVTSISSGTSLRLDAASGGGMI